MLVDGHRTDVVSMLPARFLTAHMTARNPGTWLLNCMVNDHYGAGMFAMFKVVKCTNNNFFTGDDFDDAKHDDGDHDDDDDDDDDDKGKLREYFIAADEVTWDYGPSGLDNYFGGSLTAPDRYFI